MHHQEINDNFFKNTVIMCLERFHCKFQNKKSIKFEQTLNEINHRKVAFTLAEMMVVMLVLSIVLAASMPVITRRANSSALPQDVPTGTIVAYAGTTAPSGWLLCDGSTFDPTLYPQLYSILSANTTPNIKGRVILGASGPTYPLYGDGGAESVTLTEANLATHTHSLTGGTTASGGEHSHSIDDQGHNHALYFNVSAGTSSRFLRAYAITTGSSSTSGRGRVYTQDKKTGITINSSDSHTHSLSGVTAEAGNSDPFSIMPPYYVLNYIIKAK